MAYTGFQNPSVMDLSQSGLNSCALPGSTMYANVPINDAASEFQLYMKGLASNYEQSMSRRIRDTTGTPGADCMPFSSSGEQMFPLSIHGNAAVPSPYGFQNPFQGLAQQTTAITPPSGMPSFLGDELQANQHAAARSNKIKEKIQQLHPFYSRRITSAAPLEGKTRTRDKYRVVYTEKQRVGLEKAYKEDKFITMAKKAELSKTLGLSDRQIKIWFQNRRAKERRDVKKNSPTTNATSPEYKESFKPSCRFEKEDIRPCNQQDTAGYPSLQVPVQSGYSVSNYSPCDGYDHTLLTQTRNQKLADAEVTSKCPDVAQARFQMSPSEWMEAYHQPMMTTINVSPFTSSVNFLPRA